MFYPSRAEPILVQPVQTIQYQQLPPPIQLQQVQMPITQVQQVPPIPVQQVKRVEESNSVIAVFYALGYVLPIIWMVQLFFIFSRNVNVKLWGYRALSALLLYIFITFLTLFLCYKDDLEHCRYYYYNRY
ncbi:hypothetical protein EIN_334350 [Entamoeba invadens IP1]|uniref:Uncharacterized protein n=1 Tax=Entamoeba invadens IP1 TaxID=370355 RepID=A0A0A1UG84_ENTIV|nr:hypothetical protein EIN_334350 [Entamoeba invadens IP1]ELP92438.1 hypothetical protein EIN_334350 [Entamoeba invadens IP1]|eukprot:XP_004259209.1 hypothetical protein EIN_334350 [Entamoeba invadens IP1]